MKKIIFILVFLAGFMNLSAQELLFDEFITQMGTLEKTISENFKNKNYEAIEKSVTEAITLFNRLSGEEREKYPFFQANNYYNLACVYSLRNRKKEAVAAFETCVNDWGYTNYSHATTDSDLDNIRNEKRFITLMQSIREKGDYLYILKQAGKYEKSDTAGLPHFVYEDANNGRLKDVKNLFNLDSIAGQGDEISKIINLMTWVHNTIRHDGNNYALCEFDAIDFYNYHKATGKGINCRGLAIALNECYLAMGFKSRYVTCMPKNEKDSDCHVINCVYSTTLQKWLWMDPTFNAYVKDENNNLLSIEEVRERLINDKPLFLNQDANWNNQTPETKEKYLDSYMAKNLYWLQCPTVSKFNPESRYRNNDNSYISLMPLDYAHSSTNQSAGILVDGK
ncbi:MAG: transglutaminase domain-containing protein, partial [Prevotellaceae bacterium]|nr:transglutaminase domain-containing protein [Prevotellaceae bacterium]